MRTVLVVVTLWTGLLRGQPAPPRARSVPGEVTFSDHIVRIFQRHCQTCHRPGTSAPFSLMTYADARARVRDIKQATQARRMPPWKPVPGYGEFLHERRLTQREIDMIARWVDLGAPEGNLANLPGTLEFPQGWAFGQPDLVLEPPAEYEVPAAGSDVYRCFSIPTQLSQDKHLTKVDVQPGNRAIVHHVLLFHDPAGLSAGLDQPGSPQPGYECFGGAGIPTVEVLAGWAPGIEGQTLPPGVGLRMRAGGRVILQVHYHPNGSPQRDRTRVGLYFAQGRVERDFFYVPLVNTTFEIPAGAARHTVTASLTIPPLIRARVLAIIPHMHLLGREIRVELVRPDGERRPMIYIDDWDFEWQAVYFYREPLSVRAGDRIEVTAIYDNSEGNPRNPNRPPKAVRWGEQTTDEMCLVFLGATLE